MILFDWINFQEERRPARYVGDGVYAIFDGFGIWLHANHHENPTDRIYLEPNVMTQLIQFSKDIDNYKKEITNGIQTG